MELGLPLLDPERGLLGPGLELLAHPPELLLGIAVGEGIDLIDLIDRYNRRETMVLPSITWGCSEAEQQPLAREVGASKKKLIERS